MSFNFNCPYCGQLMNAEDAWIGKESQCPTCGKKILIQKNDAVPNAIQPTPVNQPFPAQQTQQPAQQQVYAQPQQQQVYAQPQQQVYAQPQQQVYTQPQQQQVYAQSAKSRIVYILLAFFLGGLGIHNFYAGYTGRGITQLLITVLLAWLVIPAIAVGIWVIIEMIVIRKDASGVPFN
jgi:TM2 domain-containing membrane protein YozV/DNA-directed RNA polymerase subunit RPC12/RpoP